MANRIDTDGTAVDCGGAFSLIFCDDVVNSRPGKNGAEMVDDTAKGICGKDGRGAAANVEGVHREPVRGYEVRHPLINLPAEPLRKNIENRLPTTFAAGNRLGIKPAVRAETPAKGYVQVNHVTNGASARSGPASPAPYKPPPYKCPSRRTGCRSDRCSVPLPCPRNPPRGKPKPARLRRRS